MAKQFTYKGKTIEELQKMSEKEIINILPARVRRSLRRGLTDNEKKLIDKIRKTKAGVYKRKIRTHQRDLIILPEMVGVTLHVYSGKAFTPIEILPEMIGHFLGEFVLTRREVRHSAPGIGATKSSAHISVK